MKRHGVLVLPSFLSLLTQSLLVVLLFVGCSGADNQENKNTAGGKPAPSSRMLKQTRLEIIRDFETQIVYARTSFPMGTKGLILREGVLYPSGEELQQALAVYGPAVKSGDPAHISIVAIKSDHIHFEINGGPIRHKKWYQHIEVSGAGGNVPIQPSDSEANPHGSFVDLYFSGRYVPELSAQQLRDLLLPVIDFKARTRQEAYLDTVPPKVKEAIQAHRVLVGMNQEMVVYAKGKAPKKVREKDGETDFEEWIYGDPPQDVEFVRFVGDEVVRLETMKVGGEKIVRTEKEVIIDSRDKDREAKEQAQPAAVPSLRRPGEDQDTVPQPARGPGGPPLTPNSVPAPPPGSSTPNGPGFQQVAGLQIPALR
jgi:hypothetical protein